MDSLRKYSSLIVWGVIVVFILIFTLVMNNLGDAPMQYDDTYYVRNYQVRYEYESGRSFKVTEQITAVFTVSGKHGIIRDLDNGAEIRIPPLSPMMQTLIDKGGMVNYVREQLKARGEAE